MTQEALILKAEKRRQTGTQAARRERKKSLVPAIIYGHKKEPVAILLGYHDLALELQHHHRLLEVELNGKKEKFLVKEVQYDYLGDKIIHVDLARVDVDERVSVTVALEFKGTPAGAAEGGILDHLLVDIEVECPVSDIPETIRANVAHLNIGDTLLAGDIELPANCKLVTDDKAHVAILRLPVKQVEEPEEVVEGEGGAAEPEIITHEKSEEEEENE